MNEQLQAALADLLTKSIAVFEQGGKFLQDQLPDVIQQLLLWNCLEYLAGFFIGVVMAVALYIGHRKFLEFSKTHIEDKKKDRNSYDDGKDIYMFLLLDILLVPIPTLLMICNLLGFLKIWIAPKVWLIEYASKFVK